jgi:RNA recognition motif-containing protein
MNIYISNLSFNVDDNGLQELFANYGTVLSAKVITDKFSGRSRGFGFVEMSDEEAVIAIKELDQSEQDGKVINVSEARPREEHSPRNNNRNFRGNNDRGYNKDNGYNRNSKRW